MSLLGAVCPVMKVLEENGSSVGAILGNSSVLAAQGARGDSSCQGPRMAVSCSAPGWSHEGEPEREALKGNRRWFKEIVILAQKDDGRKSTHQLQIPLLLKMPDFQAPLSENVHRHFPDSESVDVCCESKFAALSILPEAYPQPHNRQQATLGLLCHD